MASFIVFVSLLVGGIWALAYTRQRQYKYNPKQDYRYSFDKNCDSTELENIHIIDLTDLSTNSTLVLELKVHNTFLGHLFQPYVEIQCDRDIRECHYFEHGVRGVRYLDISRFCGTVIKLKGRHCSLPHTKAFLHRFLNPSLDDKNVLILAPHADDAEIAAFGLYSTAARSHIITITIGEEGKCDYCGLYGSKQQRALLKGKLRLHDALNVAGLGGIPQERCAMLGYFGMSLKWMFEHPEQQAVSASTGINDVNFFRRTEHTAFIKNEGVSATWDSLVRDLYSAVVTIKPDIIVTPHPDIDGHTDHSYTTYALIEALKQANMNGFTLYGYTNHHIYNESYPYGPIFSVSTLAPKFEIPFSCDAIYSHTLDESKQYDKFYALEAMHDLRDATLVIGVQKAWKHFIKQFKRTIQQRDKSYYRRGVRPNELFYVYTFNGSNKSS